MKMIGVAVGAFLVGAAFGPMLGRASYYGLCAVLRKYWPMMGGGGN